MVYPSYKKKQKKTKNVPEDLKMKKLEEIWREQQKQIMNWH